MADPATEATEATKGGALVDLPTRGTSVAFVALVASQPNRFMCVGLIVQSRTSRKQQQRVPASGIHAELLAELDANARALIKLVEFFDSVLSKAQQLVALAERRAAELRDAAPR